jgi:hypothetical protein
MPMSEESLRTKLDRLTKQLTPKQQEFLEARKIVDSDAKACRQIGSSDTSVPRWKKDSNFFTAYVIVTQMLEANRELLVSDVSRQNLIRLQEQALLSYLPKAVQIHLDVIIHGKSDEFRLRAIKMLYDYVGIGPTSGAPISKNNQALVNILSMLGPQASNEAQKRGLEVDAGIPDVVEASAKEPYPEPEIIALSEELDEPVTDEERSALKDDDEDFGDML